MYSVGTRVSLRYRLPESPAEAYTDVVGHLEATTPLVVVRTKSGERVHIKPADVMSVRELSHAPVRNSQIRAVEHAAALGWPGTEQHWLDGWLLRAGGGATMRANSAAPLLFSSDLTSVPAIVDWYAERGLPPWLALPERLLPVRHAGVQPTRVLTTELAASAGPDLPSSPDDRWRQIYQREVPLDVLCAVDDGEVAFATVADAAVGRAAVTTAPDGTRWAGLSAVRVSDDQRRLGHGRAVCESLLAWASAHGATHAYVQVAAENAPATALYESMGFRLHHRARYVLATAL